MIFPVFNTLAFLAGIAALGSGALSFGSGLKRDAPSAVYVGVIGLIAGMLALWASFTNQVLAADLPATPATFAAVYAKAQPSDVLKPAPGAYGVITLRKPLTLQGAPGVVFAGLSIISPATDVAVFCAGAEVRQVPTATTKTYTAAVQISDAKRVKLLDCKVTGGVAIAGAAQGVASAAGTPVIGLPIGRAISVERSTDVTISGGGCEASTFFEGLTFSDVSGVTVGGCNIHDIRTSMIHGSVLGPVTLDRNWLHDSRPYALGGDGDHADFIHLWTDPARGQGAVPGLTIVNNTLDQGAGQPIIGIYLDDNSNKLGFTGATIAGNVLITGNPQGIRLENTHRSQVIDNWLLAAPALARNAAKPPSISQREDVDTTLITGNVLGDTYKPKAGYSGANTFTPPGPPSDLALMLARARNVPQVTQP